MSTSVVGSFLCLISVLSFVRARRRPGAHRSRFKLATMVAIALAGIALVVDGLWFH